MGKEKFILEESNMLGIELYAVFATAVAIHSIFFT